MNSAASTTPPEALRCFGELLYKFRLHINMSQTQLANAAGLHKSYWSGVENSRLPPPRSKTIHRLALALNLDDESVALLADTAETEIARKVRVRTILPKHVQMPIEQMVCKAGDITPSRASQILASICEEIKM